MDDNGAAVLALRAEWLVGYEIEKVRVALAMDETFPCNTRGEIVSLCAKLVERWPELDPDCDTLLRRRDEQHPSVTPD